MQDFYLVDPFISVAADEFSNDDILINYNYGLMVQDGCGSNIKNVLSTGVRARPVQVYYLPPHHSWTVRHFCASREIDGWISSRRSRNLTK